jgi:hypothetical protein
VVPAGALPVPVSDRRCRGLNRQVCSGLKLRQCRQHNYFPSLERSQLETIPRLPSVLVGVAPASRGTRVWRWVRLRCQGLLQEIATMAEPGRASDGSRTPAAAAQATAKPKPLIQEVAGELAAPEYTLAVQGGRVVVTVELPQLAAAADVGALDVTARELVLGASGGVGRLVVQLPVAVDTADVRLVARHTHTLGRRLGRSLQRWQRA